MINKNRIWLLLQGKGIKLGRLEVLKLANILSNFQRFVFDYGRAKGIRKDYMLLFLEKIGEGSVDIQMLSKPTFHPAPIQAIEFIERLTVSLEDVEEAKRIVTSEFKQDGNLIIQSLKKVEKFWSQDALTVTIGVGAERPEKVVVLTPEKRDKIITLRKEFEKQYAELIRGIILESKFYGDTRRFEIITPDGEKIKCYYNPKENPELENIVYSYIKKTVEVVGFLEEKGRVKNMSVTEIKGWDNVELSGEFAGYRLKKPIILKIEYDNFNNVWCIENKELELYGCGDSLDEAIETAKVNFEVLIEEYLLESDEIMSKKAIELKNRLAEHVEVSKLG